MDEKLSPPHTAVEDFVVPIDEPTPTLQSVPSSIEPPPDTSDSDECSMGPRICAFLISLTISGVISE
ncbi:hypothetical protein G9A89_019089 [Geosiphon pyriformis]|nr:hypothetical protein G9A89_019089 [Geosiphon pyriformis]